MAYTMAQRLDIAYASVNLVQTIDLAEQGRLTIYDASYLWLANKLNAELVTLDKRLSRHLRTITRKT